ncbi:MAG: hypothetical protein HQM08_11610 [Candidatus Riflebacteria bacterium]|nr:hypothetical protein [Candidatus Riflebacteria bacterium]
MLRFRNGQRWKRFKFLPGFAVLLFFLIFSPGISFPSENSPQAGYVDSRLLISNHPLIKNYDMHTRRFLNSSSQWVSDRDVAVRDYKNKISELEKQLQIEEEKFKKTSTKSKITTKASLDEFWQKKGEIQAKINYLKKAIVTASTGENYLSGAATSDESFVKLVKLISDDVKNAARTVSQLSGGIPIFDLSCFSQSGGSRITDRAVLFTNYHYSLWSGKGDIDFLKNWLKNFRYYLEAEFPEKFSSPFISGVSDLRNEAIKKMTFQNP